jgi:hypothetical protein
MLSKCERPACACRGCGDTHIVTRDMRGNTLKNAWQARDDTLMTNTATSCTPALPLLLYTARRALSLRCKSVGAFVFCDC